MNEIRFTIIIEELQDDCKELERELVKTKTKLKGLGELTQSYNEKLEYTQEIDDVEEIIESISLMLQDNANSIQRYLDNRANRK